MRCRSAAACAIGLALVLSAAPPAAASYPPPAGQRAASHGVQVVAVGDIACPPGTATTSEACRQGATAGLATRLDPRAVLALGDLQYDTGAYRDYRHSYARSWGVLRPLTRPVPGNHEYGTSGAGGYYRYFRHRQPGQPGWYAYRLGAWRLYALNSECGIVDCDAERRWLRTQLVEHRRACTLMYMHRPRYSSGTEHGSDPTVQGLWRVADRHGVDVALAGHEHNYERFVGMDATGNADPDGIQSFVVGTGGHSLYPFGTAETGSVERYNDDFGALAMRLRAGSYTWRFKTITGTPVDSGAGDCV